MTSTNESKAGVRPEKGGTALRVLVACEYSGAVRDAFRRQGCTAFSCDLLESEEPGAHFQRDVRDILHLGWDIMVAHPPCTHLSVSGARWFGAKRTEQAEALDFVRLLMAAPIPYIAIENPISIISSKIRKPDQIIQPHQFGHPEFKATCLWLKNLPPLVPTAQLSVPERGSSEWKSWNKVHRAPPGPNRWKERSRTYAGIAGAAAAQWSRYVRNAYAIHEVAA